MSFTKGLFVSLTGFATSAFLAVSMAYAHPVLIKVKDNSELLGMPRANLAAFSTDGTTTKKIAIQVDELEDDSLLVIREPTKEMPVREKLHHPKTRDPFRGRLAAYHRIVMDDKNFQACDDKCTKSAGEQAKKICGANSNPEVLRIDLSFKKTSAFLAYCEVEVAAEFPKPVTLQSDKRQFQSESFQLTYAKSSPIVMEELLLKKDNTKIISGSRLEVMVKPKLFLPIHFTEDDLHSELTSFVETGVSTEAELAMKLKTLGITTSFEICCDMSVFNDSFYFPVVLELPFAGTSTRSGSGIYFGFNFLGKIPADVGGNLSEFPSAPKPGGGNVLLLKSGAQTLAMGVRHPNGVKGEVIQASTMSTEQAKKIGFNTGKSNIGVFMDITKIKSKGLQRFEIWFYVGQADEAEMLTEYAAQGVQYKVSRLL